MRTAAAGCALALLAPLTVIGTAAATPAGCSVPVYAHRGVYKGLDKTENTIGAYKASVVVGAGIEADVRITEDNRIVFMHDATVNRTTDGTGSVADLTLAQIKRLHGVKGGRVPTLAEAFAALPHARFLIEVKVAATWPARLLDRLGRYAERHGHVRFHTFPKADVAIVQAYTIRPVLWKHGPGADAATVAANGDGIVGRHLFPTRMRRLHWAGLIGVGQGRRSVAQNKVWWEQINSRRPFGQPDAIMSNYADVYQRWCAKS